MKLYELKRGSKFKLNEAPSQPPDGETSEFDQVFTFRGTDGMYCKVDTKNNERHYFAAWTEVTEV